MMTWSGWNKRVAIGLGIAAVSVAAFNVVLDPYSVLKTAEWMRQGYNVNERFRKIEHLRANIGKHDSFILGASTMGLFPVEEADKMRPGSNWYNLAFLAGTPPEMLRSLKYLKSQGQPIKEVMYGLDIFAFRKVEQSRDTWKREHPLVVGSNWTDWYKSHVFASSFSFGVEKVLHNMHERPRLFFDVDNTGRYFLPRWDYEMQKDHAKYIKEQIYERNKNADTVVARSDIVMIKERFDELKELKTWLDQNGVVSHFWINPMHHKNMDTISFDSLKEFRSKINGILGDVPDYSARKDITDNDSVFYDWQHFIPTTAKQITDEILAPKVVKVESSRP